jgi:hypothetical protein
MFVIEKTLSNKVKWKLIQSSLIQSLSYLQMLMGFLMEKKIIMSECSPMAKMDIFVWTMNQNW